MEEDALPNRDAVAVIRDRLWQAQFKRDPAVLGREIYINGTRFKLIGIAPPRKLDSSLGWKLQGNDICEYDDRETSRPVSTSSGVESASTAKAYA